MSELTQISGARVCVLSAKVADYCTPASATSSEGFSAVGLRTAYTQIEKLRGT